jgi:hypothetical protein
MLIRLTFHHSGIGVLFARGQKRCRFTTCIAVSSDTSP